MVENLSYTPSQILGAIIAGLIATLLANHVLEGNLTIKKGGPRKNAKWADEWYTPIIKIIDEGVNWIFGIVISTLYFVYSPQLGINILNTICICVLLAWAVGRNEADKGISPNTTRSRALLALAGFGSIHQLVISNISGSPIIQIGGLLVILWVFNEQLIEKSQNKIKKISN